MKHFSPPKYVISILERLESHGYAAYLVGGCVRDALMGRKGNDWDIATSALPNEILSVFPTARPTGIKHGTVTVISNSSSVELTTFRKDGDYLDHRRPESVDFIPDLLGDLERRDFTMNSIAISSCGSVIDPFGGEEDIAHKLIRCVGDPDKRFHEDALRMLRALRFSAVLGFEIEEKTCLSIKKNAPLSAHIAPERVRVELEKMLLSNSPHMISKLIEYGLLAGIISDWKGPVDLEGLLLIHESSRDLRYAALCALLLKQGLISKAEDFLLSLRLELVTVRKVTAGCSLVLKSAPESAVEWKRLLSKSDVDCGKCAAAAAEVLYGPGHLNELCKVISSGECFSLKQLAVNGSDLLELGFHGPALGLALYTLLDHVIDFPVDNERSLLLDLARKLLR